MIRRRFARIMHQLTAAIRRTAFWCGVAHDHERHFRRNVGNDWVIWCASCARERIEYGHEVSGW